MGAHVEKGRVQGKSSNRLTENQGIFLDHQTTQQHSQLREGNTTYVTYHRLSNVTPKVSKQAVPPGGHRKCTSTSCQHHPNGDKHSVTKNDYHCPTIKPRMGSKSVYKGDFPKWIADKRQLCRPPDKLHFKEGEFATTSTSEETYCYKNPAQRQLCRPPDTLEFNDGGFTTSTTYKENYSYKNPTRRQLCRVPDKLELNEGAFTTSSTYKESYCCKNPVEIRKSFKPVPQTRKQIPCDRTTTCGLPYKGLAIPPANLVRRKNPAAFDATIETQDKFKIWPLGPKYRHKTKDYIPPKDHMEFCSGMHADCVAHDDYQCPKLVLPQILKSKEPLQARSTTTVDYKARDTVRLAQKQMLEKPKWTFEETTTLRLAYMPNIARQVVNCKPMHKPLSSRPMLG
ncbi:stabilizer of axonemal microtubules 2-like [Lampris incognitus]|uniref:stabilizer of axonemal microtubules 2-like n=1 Tax=Lampris incognitus TaxID=2546036 RepID=UPI0024B62C19|nr:stabilizer of axonemal microtubules 2-like [Lampris incognitus]